MAPTALRDPTIWRGEDGFFAAAGGDPTGAGVAGSFELKVEDTKGAFLRSLAARSGFDVSGLGVSALLGTVGPTRQLQIGRYRAGKFSFAPIAPNETAPFKTALGTSVVEEAADLDGNGVSDLTLRSSSASGIDTIRVWPDVAVDNPYELRNVRREWVVQATGDLDGDGSGDLVWRYTATGSPDSGASFIWYQDKGRYQLAKRRGGAPLGWEILGAADITADGADDLLYLSPSRELRALIAAPDRTCVNIGAGTVGKGEAPLYFADFFNTGGSALASMDTSTGDVKLYTFDGSALALSTPPGTEAVNAPCTRSDLSVAPRITLLGRIDPSWLPLALGDFTGDDILDIVWATPDRRLVLWRLISPSRVEVNSDAGRIPDELTVIQTNSGAAVTPQRLSGYV